MDRDDLTIRFVTAATPDEAYAAINDVRGWWTGDIEGDTSGLGAEFTYRHGTVHRSTQRVTEQALGRRIAWHVTDSHLDFVEDPGEWTGTDIVFDIAPTADGTAISFTHAGLSARLDCFDSCSDAWRFYVGTSLRSRMSGAGSPS